MGQDWRWLVWLRSEWIQGLISRQPQQDLVAGLPEPPLLPQGETAPEQDTRLKEEEGSEWVTLSVSRVTASG